MEQNRPATARDERIFPNFMVIAFRGEGGDPRAGLSSNGSDMARRHMYSLKIQLFRKGIFIDTISFLRDIQFKGVP